MERMLAGRVAVVTGGSRGIGAGVCRRLAHAGAAVVVSGRDRDAIAAVTRSITTSGDRAVGITADATSEEALEHLREETERTFGPADVVLAFAGGGGAPLRFDETTLEAWNATVETNLTATFLTLRAFVPGMMRRGNGAVVTMASTAGRQPGGASLAYGAAKAGVIMLTRQLAQEAAHSGVRINCLVPSTIVTERIERLVPMERREKMAAGVPLRRLGTPDDIADAVLFLVSDHSSWITGATLDMTGGSVTG